MRVTNTISIAKSKGNQSVLFLLDITAPRGITDVLPPESLSFLNFCDYLPFAPFLLFNDSLKKKTKPNIQVYLNLSTQSPKLEDLRLFSISSFSTYIQLSAESRWFCLFTFFFKAFLIPLLWSLLKASQHLTWTIVVSYCPSTSTYTWLPCLPLSSVQNHILDSLNS